MSSLISRALFASAALATTLTAQQPVDSQYTALIKQYLQDPRITTELVDHLPASATVPTPLKFLGHMPGTPGELTYAKDIRRYYQALDAASDRIKVWDIGKSEEGRDMFVLVVADEQTIRDLDKYKAQMAALTDPRKTSDAEARRLIPITKPIYWITSGMHSPETGGPEMLMELAYRLAVEETPFIQNIRNNVITMITPVIEVDGREKQVDTYYFNKKRVAGDTRLPLMYWGKYVAHDNNRDHIGQFLALSKNVTNFFLEWHPTIMHDLHEAQSYLYASTGTGPYNEALDPITVDEWWILAKNDVAEMTKRGVPGVWTYGFYDGWVPNYMFFAAHTHNATGRFYEVQSYGPDTNPNLRLAPTVTSKEWFRPNPPLPTIKWGPRNNVNIQESALLFALSHVAKNRDMWVEDYWLKNRRSVEKGRNGPTYAWVIPASQYRKQEAADVVNSLRFQGLEFNRATSDFKAGSVDVKAGDYIVRADQPYRTLADMYFSVQEYANGNPRPYDDTGWTYQLMRDIVLTPVSDSAILRQPMTPITSNVVAAGGVEGSGGTIVVANNSDNNLMAFRYRFAKTKMSAAEEPFTAGGHEVAAGSFIIPNANRAQIEPALRELGLSGYAVASAPTVKQHDLDLPRIGYVHAWQRTQDEGWVRAALDTYGVPYTYFADQKLRDGNLRAKYDVIVLPHIGGNAQSQVNGIPKTGKTPLPYIRSSDTPNLGALDQSPDIRGGMGVEGLVELYRFVQQGGTLITEGSTATLFPEYKLTTGINVENSAALFARGSVMRGRITDKKSPIVYGYEGDQMPVYFNQDPVLSVSIQTPAQQIAAAFGGGGGGGGPAGVGQNITPMATKPRVSTWDGPESKAAGAAGAATDRRGGANADTAGFGAMAQQFGIVGPDPSTLPRVVMQFPADTTQMLLSGSLAGGRVLSNKAQVIDAPLGQGHVVMFAIRPFWRWQTQGTYMLGFNTILNWNDLDAGRATGATQPVRANGGASPQER
ncbi:MAG TPA: M14 family zinc carboxypeptidase [Gemmatimonadaceae bacterium]|nr:M14 family zinc carboxypeptidase [Gemmatimonadaceae bacterium]